MLRGLGIAFATLIVLFAAAYFVVILYPLHNPHPPLQLPNTTLAIRNATIYTSPADPPLHSADILIQDGRITSVGTSIPIPANATEVPCNHCVVTAGFWNTHIHFTEPKWTLAAYKPTAALNVQLADMLTSRGFTTVVDLGSNPIETISLRRRIETGALLGPFIYTAGAAQYPPHGLPYYLRNTMPKLIQKLSPQPDTPAEAASDEETNIARGADVLKLFTGSYIERGKVLPMPLANAAAAVQVAHAHHQVAFAHPSDLEGVSVARDAGVDILAHAADTTEGITPAFLQTLVDHHMIMVTTLKMFGTTVTHNPAYLDPIYAEVRQFHSFGGALMFGTDVGYMQDYTTQDEFAALTRCGLGYTDILRMLTTTPAQRFGVQHEKGRIAPGQLADLTLLASDPATNVLAFSDVQATIRNGRVLYIRH